MKKYKYIFFVLIILLGGVIYTIFSKNESPSEGVAPLADTTSDRYINSEYGFSFKISSTTRVDEISDEPGETIIVKDDLGSFQVHINTFDEGDIVITKERIAKDIPDFKVLDSEDVVIDKLARGLAFTSKVKDNETTEVWFVINSHLYQVSAPLNDRDFLVGTLTTWKFDQLR